MQVLAVGRCWSSGGRMVMEGIGWKPSSLAGRDGLDVQKYTCGGGELTVTLVSIIFDQKETFVMIKSVCLDEAGTPYKEILLVLLRARDEKLKNKRNMRMRNETSFTNSKQLLCSLQY